MNTQTTTSPKMLGVAYLRYSSTAQDDSFNLETQIRQIKLCAAADGVEIVKIYSDPMSATNKKRFLPGISEMLEDARNGKFEIVYVRKTDNLARRLEWSLEIMRELQSRNIGLRAVEQNIDLSTSQGKLLLSLWTIVSEFHADLVRQHAIKVREIVRAKQREHQVAGSYNHGTAKKD
jgi:site-specific DNA recombinase